VSPTFRCIPRRPGHVLRPPRRPVRVRVLGAVARIVFALGAQRAVGLGEAGAGRGSRRSVEG
jgi:hypothetical protein